MRTLTPFMTGRVEFATSTAPRPPLADLVSNPTPPGQISRDRASSVGVCLGRDLCTRICIEGQLNTRQTGVHLKVNP